MPYMVYHDRKPAHSSTVITEPSRRTNLNWCSRCVDWFEPKLFANERSPYTGSTISEVQEAVDRVTGVKP